MKRKIFLTIVLIVIVSVCSVNVHASGFLNNIITQGNSFENKGTSTGIGPVLKDFITGDIMDIVWLVGNLVFGAVTVILGAKYIWSGAEGKSQVSETLPAFLVAVVFFYLGEGLVDWFTGATTTVSSASDWNSIAGLVFGTICSIVRYLSFGGLLYLGIRYMFASAEGKSQIKTSTGGLVLGIVFVFLASNAVDFIIRIADDVI